MTHRLMHLQEYDERGREYIFRSPSVQGRDVKDVGVQCPETQNRKLTDQETTTYKVLYLLLFGVYIIGWCFLLPFLSSAAKALADVKNIL